MNRRQREIAIAFMDEVEKARKKQEKKTRKPKAKTEKEIINITDAKEEK